MADTKHNTNTVTNTIHCRVHHLSQCAQEDNSGWVEGITSLPENSGATSLLNDDLKPTAPPRLLNNNDHHHHDPSLPSYSSSSSSSLASKIDQTCEVLINHIDHYGELVADVGVPGGFGPLVDLDEPSLETLLDAIEKKMDTIATDTTLIRKRRVPSTTSGAPDGHAADILLRRRAGVAPPVELRVAIIGNVDSGKSTMVGVLTRSVLDDGRGSARSKVFKHGHEESTGRTSSIGQHNLILDSKGIILNDASFKLATIASYVAKSSKLITLVDLAGHEKYFKTTAFGLTGHLPDYACLIVGANAGVVGMCKEHMGVALALRVPVFFVVTKVDLAPEHVAKHTLSTLTAILKKPGVKKKPFLVRTTDDVITCAKNMHTDSLAPIFLTSSVTGEGLDLVRMFYNLLPQRQDWSLRVKEPVEFIIDEVFSVPGVGTVVAGTVKKGTLSPNSTVLLGPDIGDGSFRPCVIKSIHYKRLPVTQVVAGQTAALALKKTKRAHVRKGMVMVDEKLHPKASWEFDADIAILTHSTTIQERYQAVIHCEIVRQSAKVVAMDKERLRSGDKAGVRFRFMQRPEYLTAGSRFVFREGKTKGIGMVMRAGEEGEKENNSNGEKSGSGGGEVEKVVVGSPIAVKKSPRQHK
jgi:GTPase